MSHEGLTTAEHLTATETLITRDAIPEGHYRTYRKTFAPRAIRVEGTFHCLTSEGNIASCTDGFLAIDSLGFPYPVNATEFALTYDEAAADDVDAD